MTDSTLPRLSRAQLRQVLEAQARGEHPPCFVCGGRVTAQHATLGTAYEEQRVLTSQPCGHQVTYNVNVAGQAQAELQDERDAADDQSPWCCSGNAEDCALCTDPNPPCPYLCPGHPRTAGNERIVGEAFAATEATETAKPLNLRQLIADALAAAAFECDGQCGLSEEACYEAHPITWAAMVNGITHVTASVTAIADVVLAALTGPVPEGLDTESWTAVRAIQLMNEAGARREAAEARVRVLEEEVAATGATEQEICPAADALCAELYRRASHLQTLPTDTRRWEHVHGETLGLRGAIGIVLGHQVTGDADKVGHAYYQAWLKRTGVPA